MHVRRNCMYVYELFSVWFEKKSYCTHITGVSNVEKGSWIEQSEQMVKKCS